MTKKKIKQRKLTTFEGVPYELLMLDEESMCYPCGDDTYPTYSVIENTLQPVYINDEETFRVAEEFIVQYPMVYVKRSRPKLEGEIIANIHIH